MPAFVVLPLIFCAALVGSAFLGRSAFVPATSQTQAFLGSVATRVQAVQAYVEQVQVPRYSYVRDTNVPDPRLDARAVLLLDAQTGQVLYQHQAQMPLPIASITKLMSALVTRELWDMGEIVTVSSSAVRVDGVKRTLNAGERITVGNLLSLMLVESSNDAAVALAHYAQEQGIDFVARMNTMASRLGMRACEFGDPAGLDDSARCTASDVGRLMLVLWKEHPDLLTITRSQRLAVPTLDGTVHTASTTNQLLATMSSILGGKTGNTDGALGCLALLVESQENHGTLMSVVLGSRARFTDTTSLLNWATTAYHFSND